MAHIISTKRLHLSELDDGDVAFIHQLFNDPDCIRFIGDRGLHTLDEALGYLKDKLIHSYRTHGYGLYKVTRQDDPQPLGICGLVKRDADNPPDIGFAFLPAYRNGGYCTEASQAIMQWAADQQISPVILAYTNPDNLASIRVLEKIGLHKQAITTLPGQDFESLILSTELPEKTN